MAKMWFMETKNSITPREVPEVEQEKKLTSVLGVDHYAHILSSFTNIMVAIFLILGAGTFFVLRLITFLQNSGVILAGGTDGLLLLILIVITLILSLLTIGLGGLGVSKAFALRKAVRNEGNKDSLIAMAKTQKIGGLLLLIATGLLFVAELLIPLLVVANETNALSGVVPGIGWLFLFGFMILAASGYFTIAYNNLKANELGADFFSDQAVEPIGRFEHMFIGFGNASKSFVFMILDVVLLFVKTFASIFIGLYKIVIHSGKKVFLFFKKFFKDFFAHSYRTKLSYFFMGAGHSFMRRPFKTVLYLAMQVGYIVYMFLPAGGFYWLSKFDNLGDVAVTYEYVCQIPGVEVADCPANALLPTQAIFQDNSMLITLYSVATILLTGVFFLMYWLSIKGVIKADEKYSKALDEYNEEVERLDNAPQSAFIEGQEVARPTFKNPLPTFMEELRELLNGRFHLTTLSVPAITISIFTILPLIFMILLAFTNYNADNGPPNTLFTWVGLQTFAQLFTSVGGSNFAIAFADIVQWTFVWAFFATISNYIFGLLLAMIINKRGVKLKKLWRTAFVITIAVPQFVTLLLMSRLLDKYGPINQTLLDLGWISQHIEFLTRPTNAKISVILVNVWVGVPYTMLITSGILMNIPADLYESARIDGAGPIAQFMKITMPYMLFVTGPYLITQFIGNINNFNVIFFLTGGGPSASVPGVPYGKTDILVTWLYNLTVGGAQQQYSIGSALGIFIFLISVFITLSLYSKTSAATQEGEFA
jgi:arabinogalactan oligomer/maltooligosaccharide transport system permease protein